MYCNSSPTPSGQPVSESHQPHPRNPNPPPPPPPPTPRSYGVTHNPYTSSHSKTPTRPGTPQEFLVPVTFSQNGTLDPAAWQMLAHMREDRSGQFSHPNTHLVNLNRIDDNIHTPASSRSHHTSASTLMQHNSNSNPIPSSSCRASSKHGDRAYNPHYTADRSHPPPFEHLPSEFELEESCEQPDFGDAFSTHEYFAWDEYTSQKTPSGASRRPENPHHLRHQRYLTQPIT